MQVWRIHNAHHITVNGLLDRQLTLEILNDYIKLAIQNQKYEEAAGMTYGIEEFIERQHYYRLKKLLDSNHILNEIIP